jgi:hypothetical protein
MRLVKVMVDELPKNCSECPLMHDRYYCNLKGLAIGASFVDRSPDAHRDINCPLSTR